MFLAGKRVGPYAAPVALSSVHALCYFPAPTLLLVRIDFLGDHAVVVHLGEAIDETTFGLIRAACERLEARAPTGVLDVVPGFTSVTVHYEPARVARAAGEPPHAAMTAALQRLLSDLEPASEAAVRTVEVPVRYGGALGPDLDELARRRGLTSEQVVAIHSAAQYVVHLIGFVPGFPYLAGLDARLATPRRDVPRTAVPAGSVGIGGSQTGIYPIESPGGWHLVGRTSLRLFDAGRDPPALLRVGDRVRFRPVGDDEYEALGGEARA